MNESPKPYEIVMMAAGAVTLVFSFLNWFEAGGDGRTAWSSGFLPLATLVPLFGVIVAGHVALRRFTQASLPEAVLGFTWNQVHLVLSLYATIITVGYLVGGVDGADKGIGFWLCLLGAIGLLVGAIMERQDTGAAPAGGTPPTTF